jgi:hypothetical protein
VVELFHLNAITGEFEALGPGTVSDDGTIIRSNPGFGITTTGWGFPACVITQRGDITGQVKDGWGNPLPGIEFKTEAGLIAVTDQNGRFTFTVPVRDSCRGLVNVPQAVMASESVLGFDFEFKREGIVAPVDLGVVLLTNTFGHMLPSIPGVRTKTPDGKKVEVEVIRFHERLSGAISESGSVDVYLCPIKGEAEAVVFLDRTSSVLDPVAEIYGPDGTLLAVDDDSGSDKPDGPGFNAIIPSRSGPRLTGDPKSARAIADASERAIALAGPGIFVVKAKGYAGTAGATGPYQILKSTDVEIFLLPDETFDPEALRVTADDPQRLVTAIVVTTDEKGSRRFAEDGTIVAWEAAGGGVSSPSTPTRNGFASISVFLPTQAGSTVKVKSTVKRVVLDGQVFERTAPSASTIFTVVPGPAQSVTLESSADSYSASNEALVDLTLNARDVAGNPVADGTQVTWLLEGLGAYGVQQTETFVGTATATVRSGDLSEVQQLRAAIDAQTVRKSLQVLPISVDLQANKTSLQNGEGETALITASVLDQDGLPVPDGTTITWFTSKGSVQAQGASIGSVTSVGTVNGGVARATLSTVVRDDASVVVPNSERTGTCNIVAFVGNHFGRATVEFVPKTGVSLEIVHPSLVGDATADGTFPVEQIDGSIKQVPFHASTEVIVRGAPFDLVEVELGTLEHPNDGFFAIDGAGESATVQLDGSGTGVFTLRSIGILAQLSEGARVVEIHAHRAGVLVCSPECDTQKVVSEKQGFWGHTFDLIGGFVWGRDAGVDSIAGDITASVFVWGDIRDLALETLKLAPGGDRPNTMVATFAGIGLFTEIPGAAPADAVVGAIKAILKRIDPNSPLAQALRGILRRIGGELVRLEFTTVRQVTEVTAKIVADPDFLSISARMVRNGNDFDNLAKFTDDFAEKAVPVIKRAAANTSDEAAMRMVGVLSKAKPKTVAFLKASAKSDEALEAVAKLIKSDNGITEGKILKILNDTFYVEKGRLDTLLVDMGKLSDVPGLSVISEGLPGVKNLGFQRQLAVSADRVQNVRRLERKVGTTMADIELLDGTLVEVKSGDVWKDITPNKPRTGDVWRTVAEKNQQPREDIARLIDEVHHFHGASAPIEVVFKEIQPNSAILQMLDEIGQEIGKTIKITLE